MRPEKGNREKAQAALNREVQARIDAGETWGKAATRRGIVAKSGMPAPVGNVGLHEHIGLCRKHGVHFVTDNEAAAAYEAAMRPPRMPVKIGARKLC